MIKEFCKAWEMNKGDLEEYFKTNKMGNYTDYIDIVTKLFEIVINPYLKEISNNTFELDNMTRIDDGNYQGTLIFIIPEDRYQPSIEEYIYTCVYYGSCSGCDTLQAIHGYDYNNLPSDEQVEDFMSLALHLLEQCNWMKEREVEDE